MFELLTAFHGMSHVQQLYGSSTIEFGAQDISNQADAIGNQAADWNYGNDYGGHGTAVSSGSAFSPYSTIHHDAAATGGMFGSWAVDAPLDSPVMGEHPCTTFIAHHDAHGSTNMTMPMDVCKSAYESDQPFFDAFADAAKQGADLDGALGAGEQARGGWN